MYLYTTWISIVAQFSALSVNSIIFEQLYPYHIASITSGDGKFTWSFLLLNQQSNYNITWSHKAHYLYYAGDCLTLSCERYCCIDSCNVIAYHMLKKITTTSLSTQVCGVKHIGQTLQISKRIHLIVTYNGSKVRVT